jgi:glycosyltransferase involved in cell wall biosynthesis
MAGCFFSIIIPAYNYGRFLTRAIDSVLEQHFSDCEVIVINDGSTDNTDALMQDALKKNDPRLRYIQQENKGVSAVRNLGVAQSRGTYLLFLDADDALLPGSLDKMQRHLIAYPQIDVLICDYFAQMSDGGKKLRSNRALNNQNRRWFYYFINNEMALANGAIIIRPRVFENIRYCEGLRQAEDIPVFGLMLANFECALFLTPVLQNFKHIDSMRNQINFTPQIAQQLTDLLFDPQKMPDYWMRYKAGFLAHQYYQLSRSYEKAKQYKLAMHCYHKSLITNPGLFARLGRHVKYLRCAFKRLVS